MTAMEISDVRKLVLNEDDIVVFTVPESYIKTDQQRKVILEILGKLEKELPHKNRTILMPDTIKIQVISKEGKDFLKEIGIDIMEV